MSTQNPLHDSFIDEWLSKPVNLQNITHIHSREAQSGTLQPFPTQLNPALKNALNLIGISSLYAHQHECFEQVNLNRNILLNTGTASGKTLAFYLPLLNSYLQNNSRANSLFLFPTKALAYDQLKQYEAVFSSLRTDPNGEIIRVPTFVYDGDTPQSKRADIRKHAAFLLTNPDMLHYAILPYHMKWERFFTNLRFVVIDEIHTYRGVFGSHVANVIRRLKRISQFYGSHLQFISTSATIGNPIEFVEKMIEEPVHLISQNSAPQGKKSIIFYNPPIENEQLGIRKSSFAETIRIAEDFVDKNQQTLVFQISRRSVEISLKMMRERYGKSSNFIQAYRSGYLANDRRLLEQNLRNGHIKLLFSTNALELGMDIGGMQNVLLNGYPGSISSTMQQIGRAGRTQTESSAVFIANSSPIDQFLVKHPEYVLLRNPESALIDPNNELILLQHLRCAASELLFEKNDSFGKLAWEVLQDYFEVLTGAGETHKVDGKYYWVGSDLPAIDISLRNMNGSLIKLVDLDDHKVIGQVDYNSSLWMVHEGAIYMHQGQEYLVRNLDLTAGIAELEGNEYSYYTQANRETVIDIKNVISEKACLNVHTYYGNVQVTNRIVSYDEFLWKSNQKMATKNLTLPEITLQTQAVWFPLQKKLVEGLRERDLWLSDPNKYGSGWDSIKKVVRFRDAFTCQVCGLVETDTSHHVHHIQPFRSFETASEANKISNLVTLCPRCHRKVEINQKIRSGLSGLRYLVRNMAPLYLMCDYQDIEVFVDPSSLLCEGQPIFLIYENIPHGIGLSNQMFIILHEFLHDIFIQIEECPCSNGCPSCVGPEPEAGYGGKLETKELLKAILG